MIVDGLDGARALAGRELGPSAWLEVTQARVDAFAECTDDHQWIHVDPERAAAGPFGATIAHGLLTLSLVVRFWEELVEVQGVRLVVNYGLNRVRFPAPVPVGARIRGRFTVVDVVEVAGGVQATSTALVELEGGEKPACAAELVLRFLA
ncbi:MAG: MaoC family dehydratase [Actinobacteria bacterium]|nr:MaoC family dehydratase [Actinomycetota bacterium]